MNRPFRKSDTGSWIEVTGFVRRLLSDDDDEGPRHQRFVIDIGGGHTLLVVHNIDVAQRVPLGMGDRVRLRGLYEWNDLGGLLHWTHHDPMEDGEGGWILYRRREYK